MKRRMKRSSEKGIAVVAAAATTWILLMVGRVTFIPSDNRSRNASPYPGSAAAKRILVRIVRCNVVDALVRRVGLGEAVRKKVVAAVDAMHEVGNHARIALYEAANVVAESTIPLVPCDPRKSPS